MGVRTIIASICGGFLFGVLIVRILIGDNDGLLSFERYTMELRFGLCSAAIIGLIVCVIDGFLWWVESRKRKATNQVILQTPPPPQIPPRNV